MLILIAALLCSSAMPERLGLYPLTLPDGMEHLGDRLAAQLHEGAADLPGVRAFDLVAHSSCAPHEGPCLAAAARRAGLDAMLSAAVEATPRGYLWHLREFAAADGELLHEARGETRGGPLDLAGDLERGVCVVSGAAPCEGELCVSGALDAHLFIDGTDRGPPPLQARLAVGRHSVRLGADERRVRISYARTARLFAGLRAGAPVLLEREDPPTLALVATPQAEVAEARSQAARLLFGGGLALLAGAAGASLYATSASDAHGASGAAAALAVTGAAALAGAGLVVALTPSGAAVSGSF